MHQLKYIHANWIELTYDSTGQVKYFSVKQFREAASMATDLKERKVVTPSVVVEGIVRDSNCSIEKFVSNQRKIQGRILHHELRKRAKSGLCVFCTKPLGFMSKITKQIAHKECLVDEEFHFVQLEQLVVQRMRKANE